MARFLILILISTSSLVVDARDLDNAYEKARFRLGRKEFTAYIADTDPKRAEGLMFVEKLAADTGMLFVFEREQSLGFWMKNTLIPLNIGFFDSRGKLVDVQEMQVAESLLSKQMPPSYQSRKPALYALEMNTGWFKQHKIKEGTQLELISSVRSERLRGKLAPARQ